MEKEEAKQTAATILKQLGGKRFVVMTGAKHLGYDNDGSLSFKLPDRFAKNGINLVRIGLDPMDTYQMEFIKFKINIRAKNVDNMRKRETVALHEGIYFDQLQEIFTAETGLHTRL